MNTSIRYDMPASEYHADPALSQSTLKKIARSPQHLQWYLNNPDPDKPHYEKGRALHSAILEPEIFENQYVILPDIAKRSNKEKAFWQAWEKLKGGVFDANEIIVLGTKKEEFQIVDIIKEIAGDEFLKLFHKGLGDCREFVSEKYVKGIEAQRDAFLKRPLTRNICSGAKVEVSIFWTDPVTGVRCKARLDILHPEIVYDLKSSKDASRRSFLADAKKYQYPRQTAWYLDAASHAVGSKVEKFAFAVCENDEPYDGQVFFCEEDFINKGREENARDLARYAQCQRTNDWPGYPDTIQSLSLGGW